MCCTRGESGMERHYDRRHWRIGGNGRIRTSREQTQCKGSVNVAKKMEIHIVNRWWDALNLWGEQRLRTSILIWVRSERGEEQKIVPGKSQMITFSNPSPRKPNADDEDARNDFRKTHLSSSRRTQSQTARAERRNISFSDEVHSGFCKETKNFSSLTMCDQICGSMSLMQRRRKQNQTTKNSSSQWQPFAESWKFRCQQQRFAKYRLRVVVKPTAILARTHYSKKNKFYNSLQFCAQINSNASSIRKFQMQMRQWWKKAKFEKIPEWQLTNVKKRKRWSRKQGTSAESSFRVIDGSLSFSEFGAGTLVSKVQRQGRIPREHFKKMILVRK